MTLNCDQVFEILTRGPFPSGNATAGGDATASGNATANGESTDDAVERHLAACHECRGLAEALRPAIDLLHESLNEDLGALPGYHGKLAELSSDRVSTAVMTAISSTAPPSSATSVKSQTTQTQTTAPRSTTPQSRIWQVAAAAMLGAALCFVLAALGVPNGGSLRNSGQDKLLVTPAVMGSQPDDSAVKYLLSLINGGKCQPTVVASVTNRDTGEPRTRTIYQCCTQCHAAQRDRMESGALARVTRSCSACHSD